MAKRNNPALHLTDSLVNEILHQVAPKVTQLTGWELHLNTLKCRVLPKDRGYEELLVTRLREIGFQDCLDLLPNIFERMLEFLIEQNTLAAYLPETGEIFVVRENLDDSNLDGLKLVLAHELVHRGQDLSHAHLYLRLQQLLQQAFSELQSADPDFRQVLLIMDEIRPIMTLIESHAAYIQSLLKQTCFPNAIIESHFNLAALLMRLVGAQKLAQYTDGLPQIKAAVASGSVKVLYAAYEHAGPN
jgi:hypothetical protein